MILKKTLLAALLIFTGTAVNAQDKIIKKNGDVINARVKEIGMRTVTYKRYDNPDGPDFVINRNEIDLVRFENGTEEHMTRNFRERHGIRADYKDRNGQTYGRNILSLAPVQFTNTSVMGVGLHYERILDKRGIFSLYVPLAYSFKNSSYYDYNVYNSVNEQRSAFWAYPGVKFYPTGSNRKVSYAAGACFAIGAGNVPVRRSVYDPNTQTYITERTNKDFFQMGVMVNSSLNIQPTPHVYLGVELGLGIPYIQNDNSDSYDNRSFNYSDEPLVQFNFKIGYRF
ncbi:hypothetical protein ACTHGU_07225 [Chitinophagaceae bacterium MMS25-I14]